MKKLYICRICLEDPGEKRQSLSLENEIVLDIEQCGGISIDIMEPNMPNLICEKCLLQLKVAKKFRQTCQRSNEILLKFYKDNCSLSATQADEEYVENIIIEAMDENDGSEDTDDADVQLIDCSENSTHEIEVETLIDVTKDYSEFEEFIEELGTEEDSQLETNTSERSDSTTTNDFENVIRHTKEKIDDPTTAQTQDSTHEVLKSNKSPSKRCGKFVCSICGNVYMEKTKLNMHLRIHNKVKPHECEICHKRFAQTPQLSRHMNSHTGNRPYKCKYCSSSFADPSTLAKHERIHTNERPYKCEICGKSFAYTNVLKVHIMMHSGEKPFQCSYCDKQFSQVHHMRNHQKRHL